MKFIPKNKTSRFENSKNCIVYEYSFKNKSIDGAKVVISGRYPEVGYASNVISQELVYVLGGKGYLIVKDESKKVILKEGDCVLIEKKELFFWKGNMKLFISCAPAWNSDQYKLVSK